MPVLDYARPRASSIPSGKRALRVAVFCGAAPLFTGISIFLLWLPAAAPFLPILGLLTIAVGLLMFVIGMISLLVYLVRELRAGRSDTIGVLTRSFVALLLLLSNFPAAWMCIALAVEAHPFMTSRD